MIRSLSYAIQTKTPHIEEYRPQRKTMAHFFISTAWQWMKRDYKNMFW